MKMVIISAIWIIYGVAYAIIMMQLPFCMLNGSQGEFDNYNSNHNGESNENDSNHYYHTMIIAQQSIVRLE